MSPAMMPPSLAQDPVAASAEQVRAQMASLAAAAASPPSVRRRLPRLPEAATAILKDFFFTKSRYPTTAQKDELVAQIRAQFEGFEAYDRDCLGRWFAGQRVVHGNGKPKVEPGEGKGKGPGKKSHHKIKSDMILFPSLTKKSLNFLHVLLSETPDPLPAIIQIWADRLDATYKDVECWIRLRKVQLAGDSGSGDGGTKPKDEDGDVEMIQGGGVQAQAQAQGSTSHLPTPSESTSPEPRQHSRQYSSSSSPAPSPSSLLPPHSLLLSSTSSHFRGPGSFSGSASGTGTRAGTGYGVKEECSSPVLTRYGGGGSGAPVQNLMQPPRTQTQVQSFQQIPYPHSRFQEPASASTSTSMSTSSAMATSTVIDVDNIPPPPPSSSPILPSLSSPPPPPPARNLQISAEVKRLLSTYPSSSLPPSSPPPPSSRLPSSSLPPSSPPPTSLPASSSPPPPTSPSFSANPNPYPATHQNPKQDSNLPKTIPELNACFAPYEGIMHEFLGKVDSGSLQRFGFVPCR